MANQVQRDHAEKQFFFIFLFFPTKMNDPNTKACEATMMVIAAWP